MEGEDYNYLVVGGTSFDIVDGGKRLGGSAYYAVLALIHLGVKPVVITNSPALSKVFKDAALVIAPPQGSEIIYEIKEFSTGKALKLIKCSPTGLSKLIKNPLLNETRRINGLVLSPIACELSINDLSKLENLFAKSDVVGVDIQGFVREFKDDGVVEINHEMFYELVDALKHLGKKFFLKGDIMEYPQTCYGRGVGNCVSDDYEGLIIQTNAGGSLYVYDGRNKKSFSLKPLPEIHGGEIGTGDIFTAVLTYMLSKGENLLQALSKASVAGGLKVARQSPPWFTLPELDLLKDKVELTNQLVRNND